MTPRAPFPQTREAYVAGTWFEDEIDPTDPNFRLVRMRIPHPPIAYTCGRFEGEAALRKQCRAAAAQLAGAGALPEHIARAIFDSFAEPRFFRVDDGGSHWTVVARDQDHCMEILRAQGATWETDAGREVHVDGALELAIVEIQEMTPEQVASVQRCHTEDDRGVIPLAAARIGDAFCSEW